MDTLDIDNKPQPEKDQLEIPVVVSLLFLFFTIAVSSLIGILLIGGMGKLFGFELSELATSLSKNSTTTNRNFFRSTILINHLTMFVIPGIIFCIYMYGRRWLSFLKLNSMPRLTNIWGGVILLLLSMPFVQFLFWINQNWIPLPDWARAMESNTTDTINSLLIADAPYEFVFNVFIIALIPAIGEELIFRGILQKQLGNSFKSSVAAIWLAALIFSAFHMQFEGFLPRLILGALLGYLYYWSNNLWIPIIAHFMNNFLQILAQYLFQKELSDIDLDSIEVVPWWQWLSSFLLVLTVGYLLQQYNNKENTNKKNTLL